MTASTDTRKFTGDGSNLGRDQVGISWNGPIAANEKIYSGCLAGQLLADTATHPAIKNFVGNATMRCLGFVTLACDNTGGALGALPCRVTAESGTLIDKNAGGGSAITIGDLYKPIYGVDNQTCSKVSSDGDLIGMLVGIDAATGNPVVMVDPVIAAQVQSGDDSNLVHLNGTETITGAKTFNDGKLKQENAAGTFATTLASAATAARTFTLPDATDTAVGLAATQELTNKTMTGQVVKNGVTASGSTSNDFSGSSGTFKTSTGTNTWGGKTASGATTNLVADPGNAGAIPVTTDGVCALTSAGAETRTLAIPTFIGQRLTLSCDVKVGNIVTTVATAFDSAAHTTITMSAAGQAVSLIGVQVAGVKCWRLQYNDGCTLG